MHHRPKSLLLTLAALAIMIAIPVHAQEVGSTTPEDRAAARQEERAAAREERQEFRNTLSQQIQNRVRNLVANIVNPLTAALNRMESIITRLDSRIEKMSVTGFDTTPAKAKLGEAKDSLARARDMLSNISPIEVAVSGDTPRIAYQEIRTELIAVREEILKIHALLRETVALLKNANETPEIPATSTEPLPAQ